MVWHAETPYNELPDLPPQIEIETRAVLKATIEARAALASLDKAAQLIPNPAVLINSIPLLEAQASSEIENILTTTDELFGYAEENGSANTGAAKETIRYRIALSQGVLAVRKRPLNLSTAIEVCSLIQEREMSVRTLPGTRVVNPSTRQIIYTPPEGEGIIRDRLSNWERFIHETPDLDPLVKMAVAHYQFEAIHPFEDGNGRTGRVVNLLMLVSSGLLHEPILYMSRYIIRNKNQYYRLLQQVTEFGIWEEWILYILEAVRSTSVETVNKIDAIGNLQHELQQYIRTSVPNANNPDLLAVLFEQPYCRIKNVVERCAVTRPTAGSWLHSLADSGVLVSVRKGREQLFINTRFLDLLTSAEAGPARPPETPALF